MTLRALPQPISLFLEELEERLALNGSLEFRSITGMGNNETNPDLGVANTQLLRILSDDYDGFSDPAGGNRPSARAISNAVADQSESVENNRDFSNFVFQWGQFLDHDIDLSESAHPNEPFNIPVPTGDPFFDPFNTGTQVIELSRTVFDPATGTTNPRQQVNQITSFIDASNVYGSGESRANELRTGSDGLLKTSAGNLLPFNVNGFANAGGPSPNLFLAGDVRANEQVGLTAMHTLFVREHNRLAGELKTLNPSFSDDDIYNRARVIVGAQMQVITYNEFLPAVLGPPGLEAYKGYVPGVNPGIANEFSTAAFRVGHTMLPSFLSRVDEFGNESSEMNLPLRDGFFAPDEIIDHGIDSLLRGLAQQKQQEIDRFVVDDVRNFLFGPPGAGGFDLASLNIQRGRDHGIPGYNQARRELGLTPVNDFSEFPADSSVQSALASIYPSVEEIDLWVGGIAEDHVTGSSLGETFTAIWVDQFTRLRDGDRFWYENDPALQVALTDIGQDINWLKNTLLSDIIVRNTGINNIQSEVFRTPMTETYRAPAEAESIDVTIRFYGRRFRIIDNEAHRILVDSFYKDTSSIVLFATPGDDKVIVDLRKAQELPIELYFGEGKDTLVINGTNRDDIIGIQESLITVDNTEITFGKLERLIVDAGRGDDNMTAGDDISPAMILKGGRGDDEMTGGNNNEVMFGGRGKDTLIGGPGLDVLIGGIGRDVIHGGESKDLITGNWVSFLDDHHRAFQILEAHENDEDHSIFFRRHTIRNDRRVDLIFGGEDLDDFIGVMPRDQLVED